MDVLSLSDGASQLKIELLSWDGDAYVAVHAQSHGFAGRNDLHVASQDFKRFCGELVALQKSLKGEARLVSAVEGELDIRIAPADSRGHIAVTGNTGYNVQAADNSYWHSVHFGFQVEPGALDAAVKVPWVSNHAV
ncbi:MAG TPA: hypothetical protein VKB41_04125 [Steroidobacteraceae bacterium]|nr:hypothetical protein [Steroidobacteraceae bacterium]